MPDTRDMDRAAGLRRGAKGHAVRVMAVTSGKGGVGKTNVSVNLAAAMINNGKDVMLLDADLGLANIDVLLGLNPTYNLAHVLNGSRSLEEVIVKGPGGLKIIPAASGIKNMANLSPAEHAGLIKAFSELSDRLDVLVVDTAAGISDSVISFTRACQEVIVVVCDEPASITDAYALIKVLSRDYGQGFLSSSALVWSAMPGMQKPHWSPAAVTNEREIRSRSSSLSPSRVTISLPSALVAGTAQVTLGSPSIRARQHPHWACG